MDARIGFVSTYPPTNCGIATFSSSLMVAMDDLGSCSTKVVRLVGSPLNDDSKVSEILSTMKAGDLDSITRAIDALNKMDVAIIQHEFGIYGGEDGDEVLILLRGLRVPTIAVLHTVLSAPSQHQRFVIVELCRRVSVIVVMSNVAYDRLVAEYLVDRSKVFIVPHGARRIIAKSDGLIVERPLVLTWGLIGPGKGIEWVIEAMDMLRDLDPAPRYVVAGRTHPKVFERERESYRESLQCRIDELRLNDSVQLQSNYLRADELDDLIASSSVVVLPYDTLDQVTSGVLIEAISAGRPVIATRFPYAVELLEGDVGILVPHRNPVAIAKALRRLFLHPDVAEEMSQRTQGIAKAVFWPAVAARYMRLASILMYYRVSA